MSPSSIHTARMSSSSWHTQGQMWWLAAAAAAASSVLHGGTLRTGSEGFVSRELCVLRARVGASQESLWFSTTLKL